MKIDTKKIGTFLKSVDGADFIYLKHTVDVRDSIQRLIKQYDLTKKDVCDRFKINPKKYVDFIKGNYKYSLDDISILEVSFEELSSVLNKTNKS